MSTMEQALFAAVIRLLRPLVRILLRNGVPYHAFADLAKRVYVDVAAREFGVPGRKQTVSRVSIITGLSRKEVSRVKSLPEPKDTRALERYNRAARVISGWIRDVKFKDNKGREADLPLEGRGATFSQLVKRYSGDMPVRAILDELLRVGAVERLRDGRIHLRTRAYLPQNEEAGKLGILGTDVRDLIRTIDHNLRSNTTESFFQRKVAYDNLPAEILPQFRALTLGRGQSLLEEMDRWLSQHDRDVNPSTKGTGRKRAGMAIYYFEEDVSENTLPGGKS
ncbi:MAG: hypothetical protein HY204_02535 [Nitrospirae bacterium]|nr:hypothetical protein [Nitrospirota bacterium]